MLTNQQKKLAKECLELLAKKASFATNFEIEFSLQKDSAIMLKSAAIHPLQLLENVHQRMVREVGQSTNNSDTRWEKEQAKLSEFFPFDTGKPELMLTGNEQENEDNFSETELAQVQMLYNIEPFYLFRLLVPFRLESDREITEDDKRKASGELTGLLNNKREWLEEWLKEKLKELDTELRKIDKDNKGQKCVFFHLKGGRALAYLIRHPKDGENDWDTSIVINPNLPADEWYKKFNEVHNLVLRKLKQFKKEFSSLVYKNAETFKKSLQQSGSEPDNPEAFDESLDDEIADLFGEELEPSNSLPKYFGNCKAELIDIGIPRRDTVEAFEQWSRTEPGIINANWTDDISIPSHLYYINEYVMMIREALTGTSPSMPKTPKRIRRLYDILNGKYEDENEKYTLNKVIAHELEKIDNAVFSKSLQVINNQGDDAIKKALTVIFEQFIEAYNLKYSSTLAQIFDKYFAEKSSELNSIIQYPPPVLQNPIDKDKDKFRPETHGELLKWSAFAQYVSEQFEKHFREQAKFFGFSHQLGEEAKQRKKLLGAFVKALYTESIFSPEEELEVQFAVTGSFAAYLHADYAKADKLNELDPVNMIEMKLFCYPARAEQYPNDPENADPNIVIETLFKPALNKFLSNTPDQAFKAEYKENGLVLISWDEEEKIGDFSYKPLVAKITVTYEWPQLAFIWGYPVISLRDLIREYDRKSAETEEYGAKQRLRKTSSILKGILTKYD